MDEVSKAASMLGRLGGLVKSKAKKKASRLNGELGGRPRQFPRCPRYGSHRFDPKTLRCPCGYRRK